MLMWFKKSFAGPGVAATRSPVFKKVAETPWHLQPGQPEPRKVEKVPGSLALVIALPVMLPQNLSFHLCKRGVWGDPASNRGLGDSWQNAGWHVP